MPCLACDLTAGRVPLPGGTLYRTPHWVVEHCVGPLGLGCLVVKPQRHLTSIADLDDDEAAELGPLLRRAAQVARDLVDAEQVYICLWSHAGAVPGHVHYVVQPVTRDQVVASGAYGPALQVQMFQQNRTPGASEIAAIATRAREMFLRRG